MNLTRPGSTPGTINCLPPHLPALPFAPPRTHRSTSWSPTPPRWGPGFHRENTVRHGTNISLRLGELWVKKKLNSGYNYTVTDVTVYCTYNSYNIHTQELNLDQSACPTVLGTAAFLAVAGSSMLGKVNIFSQMVFFCCWLNHFYAPFIFQYLSDISGRTSATFAGTPKMEDEYGVSESLYL